MEGGYQWVCAALVMSVVCGVGAFELTVVDRDFIQAITSSSVAGEMNLYHELGGRTFENPEKLRQLSASRIFLSKETMEQASFRWKASPEVNPDGLHYTMKEYEDWRHPNLVRQATVAPVFSVPSHGMVPTEASDFSVGLNCTGAAGMAHIIIEIYVYSGSQAEQEVRHTIIMNMEANCKDPKERKRIEACDYEMSPRSNCKQLCADRTVEELSQLFCNASAILVGTFRKSRRTRDQCQQRHVVANWRMKQFSSRNVAFGKATKNRTKKLGVVVGSDFKTCKCLRRLKRDKRYVFVGEMDKEAWVLRLRGVVFMSKRTQLVKQAMENTRCGER